MASKINPGWWNPQPFDDKIKRPFHYVGTDGRSLCGKWAYHVGLIVEGNDEHPENCLACEKKRKKEKRNV